MPATGPPFPGPHTPDRRDPDPSHGGTGSRPPWLHPSPVSDVRGPHDPDLRTPRTVQGPHTSPGPRDRRDRCPGALRPWPAEDGLLVRLRLVGGRLPLDSLPRLFDAAQRYGDGRVHVTVRANLQLRALPGRDGYLDPEVVDALRATGLLPSRTHELVRNVMVSPASGLWGGRADLRPVAAELDRLLCAAPHRAALPGRFLFVLDDGRGDLRERTCDLGLAALDARRAQLRAGQDWGPEVALDGAAEALAGLADRFLELRGEGPSAAWHVSELPAPLTGPVPPHPRLPPPTPPLPYGPVYGDGEQYAPGNGRPDPGRHAPGGSRHTADGARHVPGNGRPAPGSGRYTPGGGTPGPGGDTGRHVPGGGGQHPLGGARHTSGDGLPAPGLHPPGDGRPAPGGGPAATGTGLHPPGGGPSAPVTARHVPVPDTGLDRPTADALAREARAAGHDALVVTPWRGVLVPGSLAHGGRP